MKRHVIITAVILAVCATGCGLLTPAVDSALNSTGIAVLCSLEEEELADPALDADCQKLASTTSNTLTADERAAIVAHANHAAMARKGWVPGADAGHVSAVDGGAQ